ncbi:DUF1015 domain-containing protein [soil metagenome]
MVDAAPFRALRYDAAVAGDPAATSAPAYDSFERFTYARHRTASPYTVLELLAPRDGARYRTAGVTYERWRRTGVLRVDPKPAFLLYEEHELRHGVPAVQRGVLAAVGLEPLDGSGAILPHEAVDPARVADRLQRLEAVPADITPVFALYTGGTDALRELLARPPRAAPLVAFSDESGVDHRVWRLDAPEEIATLRAGLASVPAVIADGHHRYATALAYRKRRPAEGAGGPEPAWARTLMYLVESGVHGPAVHAVHRLVQHWQPGAPGRIARDFRCEEVAGGASALERALARAEGQAFGLCLAGGVGLLLRPRDPRALAARLPADRSSRWRSLDAAVLDHAVLPSLGARGVQARAELAAAAAEVDEGAAAALFLLRPVTPATVLALAAEGERMPPKTTWFRPKPRAGLIMRTVESDGPRST